MKFGEKRSPEVITATMIAPCGMNCGICSGFLRDGREKNVCPGCNGDDARKPVVCATCRIKNCPGLHGAEPVLWLVVPRSTVPAGRRGIRPSTIRTSPGTALGEPRPRDRRAVCLPFLPAILHPLSRSLLSRPPVSAGRTLLPARQRQAKARPRHIQSPIVRRP